MRRPHFHIDFIAMLSGGLLCCAALACSPKQVPPPEEPAPSPLPSEPVASAAPATEDAPPPEAQPVAKDPEFTPGMSVREAVDAAQGTDRIEIEQEVLAEPIVKPELYQPCKLRPNQHFKLTVAIWEGRVVGMDLVTTPKSDAADECIRAQVQGVTWKKKAKALSTFEFNF